MFSRFSVQGLGKVCRINHQTTSLFSRSSVVASFSTTVKSKALPDEYVTSYLADYSNIRSEFLSDMREQWFVWGRGNMTDNQLQGLYNVMNASRQRKPTNYFKKNRIDPVQKQLLLLNSEDFKWISDNQSKETAELMQKFRDQLIEYNYLTPKQTGVVISAFNRMNYLKQNPKQ